MGRSRGGSTVSETTFGKRLTRRTLLGGIAGSAAAAILAACGGGAATNTPAPAPTAAGGASTATRPAASGATSTTGAVTAPAGATVAVGSAPSGTAVVAAGPKTKLKIMVGGLSKQIYLPNMLTKQLGFFDEQNLDIELIDEASGQSAEQEVLTNNVNAASGSYDHTIDVAGLGKSLINVIQLGLVPGGAEMVSGKKASDIKSPADWKGKNFGITSLGSGSHLLSQYLAGKNGVKPSEVNWIPAGAGATLIAAFQQGKIDMGWATEPTLSQLVKTGDAKIQVDLRTPEAARGPMGGDYPFICLFMQYDYVQKNKPVVQRLVNSYVKTLKWINTHSAEEITDKMPADYYSVDKAAYISALKDGKAMFSPDGKMPKGGPEFVLSVQQQFNENVKDKKIDLSKTYTTEFADSATG